MIDEAIVKILQQIADDPYLPQQVLFFLKTLADEETA